jgi:5-formyltetrahydrofolate cyclo-ligase
MPDIRSPFSPFSDKATLRRVMEARRAVAFAQNPEVSLALRDRFLETIQSPQNGIVAAYNAQRGEIDPMPLAEGLRARGYAIALPVMAGRDQPLAFRSYDPAVPLVKNRVGIGEPPPSAALVVPDVVLVPLLAFDARGHRLGSGGGYYDRTLPDLRRRKAILAIGLAFAAQECAEIPAESHDAALDMIVTELQVFSPSLP